MLKILVIVLTEFIVVSFVKVQTEVTVIGFWYSTFHIYIYIYINLFDWILYLKKCSFSKLKLQF